MVTRSVALPSQFVIRLLLSTVAGFLLPRAVAAQVMQPMCVSGCITYNVDVPDISPRTWAPNTSGHTASFQVWNKGASSDEYSILCGRTGPVTSCSPSVSEFVLAPGGKRSVTVTYNVGSAGSGTVTLTADGVGDSDMGSGVVNVAGPPAIALTSPGSGSTVAVHNRQPIIRAYFTPGSGDLIDTTRTVLTWRGETVTPLARHNRGLLEWEVDSTHWLTAGLPGYAHADTAALVLTTCGTYGGCTTATRTVTLSDATPILGFSAMPLGTANGGFSAPFGPGLSLSGPDLTTGFATRSRTSLGLARSVGLVYSTVQSYPRALVSVDLDIPWPATTPSSITVRLKDNGVAKDSVVLTSPNTSCLTGTIRRCRVTLQADYSSSAQTVLRKWLTVEATVVTDQARTSSDSVEVVIVDRRTSPYGSGWWPAMYSKLVQAGGDRILVSASGTASIYRGNGDTLFLPPPGSFTSLTYAGIHELRTWGSTGYERYDVYGRRVWVVDPSGNADSLVYDGSTDRLRWHSDPVGQRDSLLYDGNSLLNLITGPIGRRDTVTIDGTTHQLTRRRITSPSARPDVVTYFYQAYTGAYTNVLTTRIGSAGDTTQVIYDSTFKRRPVQAKLPRVQDETGAWVTPTLSYTAYERQGWGALRSLDSLYVEMKDPLNHWTRSLLNGRAQPVTSWDALGVLGRSGYDADGFVLWSEGKNGDSSRVYTAYDGLHRMVKTYILRGASNVLQLDSLVYDVSHRVIQRIDCRGQVTTYAYDGLGRPTKVKTPNGAGYDSVMTWYTSRGLVDSTKSSAVPGAATRYAYTPTGNMAMVLSNTNDTLAIRSYDAWGRMTSTVSRMQVGASAGTKYWQWTRDTVAFGVDNLVEWTATQLSGMTTNPAWAPSWMPLDTNTARQARSVYDAAGRMTGRVNNRGTQTSYSYDRLGRVVARRPWADSVAVKDSLVYDIAGNLKKAITRRGTTITHYYDSRNRDTLTVIPGVGDVKHAYGGPGDQVTRVWMANAVDSIGGVNGEVRYGYDSRGRLRADTAYTGSIPRVTTYAYDTYERPSSTVNPLGTWSVRYESVRGLADTLITPMADTVITVIDAKGQLTSRTIRSNAAKVSYVAAYKMNLGLLADTTAMLGGTPYIAGSFSRISEDTSIVAMSPKWLQKFGAAGSTQTLQDSTDYDSWGRLTQWSAMKDGALQTMNIYGFDANGNLRTDLETIAIDAVTDRLTSRVISGATERFQYDRAGNLLTDSVPGGVAWQYGYDAVDRLVSVRRNGVLIARYGYDVLGRRIVKRVYSSVTGGTVGYLRMVYTGNQVAFETDSAGTIGLRYTWGPGADNLLAIQDEAGNHSYATTDRLGSVRSLAKRDGTWLLTRRWSPYGNQINRDSSVTFTWGGRLRYGWTGREYDTETGLYFHRARYYAPTLRRFIQEDPVEGSTSPYAYVNGSPLEATDPSGMMMSWEMRMPDTRMQEFLAGNGPAVYIDGVSYGGGSWAASLPGNSSQWFDEGSDLANEVWTAQRIGASYDTYVRNFGGNKERFEADPRTFGGKETVGEIWSDMTVMSKDQFTAALDFSLTDGLLYSRISDRFDDGNIGVGNFLADMYARNSGRKRSEVLAGTVGDWTELRESLFSDRIDLLHNMVVHESFHAFHHDWSEQTVCFQANRMNVGRALCY